MYHGPVSYTHLDVSKRQVEYHAMIMAQSGIKREMIRVASDIMKVSSANDIDSFHLLNKTAQSFCKISERNIRKDYGDAKSIMKSTITESKNEKRNNIEVVTGVPSRYRDLD